MAQILTIANIRTVPFQFTTIKTVAIWSFKYDYIDHDQVSQLMLEKVNMGKRIKILMYFIIATCASNTHAKVLIAGPGEQYTSINSAVSAMSPGDTVLVKTAKYSIGAYLSKKGLPGKYLTIKNYPGEMPEINGWNGSETNGGSAFTNTDSSAEYLRIEGFYITGFKYGGFSLNWKTVSSEEERKSFLFGKNIEIRNNVVDLCGVNGISVFYTENVIVENNLVSRTGWQESSWSSGINMLGNGGIVIVRNNVTFHHIDISSHHTDGNGFIFDQSFNKMTLGLVENNISFLNGGSGFGTNQSANVSYIGNTSYNNWQDNNFQSGGAGGISFSNLESRNTIAFKNNLCIQTNRGEPVIVYGTKISDLKGTVSNNFTSKSEADAAALFLDASSCDFRLKKEGVAKLGYGLAGDIYSLDNGFDPHAIKKENNSRISFYTFSPDIDYIKTKGGLSGCFQPKNRGAIPSIGAYEPEGATAVVLKNTSIVSGSVPVSFLVNSRGIQSFEKKNDLRIISLYDLCGRYVYRENWTVNNISLLFNVNHSSKVKRTAGNASH